ncbi:hypothetical protein W97_05668 [Coniosporium apollinis CBS 100218]|uniref:IBR domain-containing protein n=1 Tax=Coniosporium apollinis (strain CBS 100218) TaxID=1168221 RepID=R7YWG0_CONA1|nr:uncharacterized protein W97_05668 [Coniosporium apollinis CBS 100218]EON66275.1 hypothetical protein W97_05668 [Coniosporium apollinis CBS 100218]
MPSLDGAPADISSAKLIFDDRLYEQEVLGLKEGQTEEKLQDEIAAEARQLGIEPYLLHGVAHTSKPASTVTISSEHRSSVSLESRGSHSTEFTSDPSRSSKDQADRPPSFTNSQRQRPWAPDAKEEDARTSSRPTVRYSYSYSEPQTASESTFSLSSALSGRSLSTKRKRGTSILSMFRKQPCDCNYCPQLSHHPRQTYKLECGHSLCRISIRQRAHDATEDPTKWPPTCCDKPIPDSILGSALKGEDLASALRRMALADGLTNGTNSASGTASARNVSASPSSRNTRSRPVTASSAEEAPLSHRQEEESEDLARATAEPTFRALRAQQEQEYERLVAFEQKQRKALAGYQAWSRRELAGRHDEREEELSKKHTEALERLEEKQVAAELDLRAAHREEQQNADTALKYMEAYVNGSSAAEKRHIVTAEDKARLASQRALKLKLDARHESAISVLRAKQERDSKAKLQKMQAEREQLEAEAEKEEKALKEEQCEESHRLAMLARSRRRRVAARWDLRMEVWKAELEREKGGAFHRPLPGVPWPLPVGETMDQSALGGRSALDEYERLAGACEEWGGSSGAQ